MAHGGMSPRGGLSGVSADADARREDEPVPSTGTTDDASSGVRVTLADSTRAQVLRAFLRHHSERRANGDTASSGVDALLDSMEAARRETSSVSLERAGAGPPARVSDDVFSFGSGAFGNRSGSARSGGAPSASNDTDAGGGDDDSFSASASGASAFGIDARAAARWLEHTAPVCVILLVSFLFARLQSLAAFAWTTAVFLRADDAVRRAVSESGGSALRGTDARTPNAGGRGTAERVEAEILGDVRGARGSAAGFGSESDGFRLDEKDVDTHSASMDKRRFARLVAALLLSGSALLVLAAVFPAEPFWDALAFRDAGDAESADSFPDSLWRAAMADTCARLGTVGVKAFALILADARSRARKNGDARQRGSLIKTDAAETATEPFVARGSDWRQSERRAWRAARARGRAESCFLALLENASLLVRTGMPTTTWFAYFMRGARETHAPRARSVGRSVGRLVFAAPADAARLGACFAAGAYLAVKARAVFARLVACRAAAAAVLDQARDVTGLGAGARESEDAEAKAAGNECSVCRDAFRAPVTLKCGHVFCERCVGAWFERSRACPLCRAVVAGKHCGAVEHGNGATVAWPYAF